jgi:pimeloyl-ACP methyl ester carboxylesterase
MDAGVALNSTIVRTNSWMLAVARTYFAILSRLSPKTASRQVERIFTSPPRYSGRAAVPGEAARRSVRLCTRDLAVWEAGAAADPAVLLAHGWGGRGVQMEHFIAPLLDRGFRVVWFDQPGHGDSGAGRVGLPDFVRALEAIDRAHRPIKAAIGHTLGAAPLGIGVRRGLRLARIVFIGSPASMSEYAKAFARVLGIAPWVREMMRVRVERRYGMRFDDIDRIEELRHVTIPALFVHDAGDVEVPFENALRLSRRMPDARLLRTYGLGHRRVLREPGVVNAVADFARGIDDVPAEWPRLPRPAPLY